MPLREHPGAIAPRLGRRARSILCAVLGRGGIAEDRKHGPVNPRVAVSIKAIEVVARTWLVGRKLRFGPYSHDRHNGRGYSARCRRRAGLYWSARWTTAASA